MKVLLCILFAFFITGCCDDNRTKEERTRKEQRTVSILNSARIWYMGSLKTCEYEGHKYVLYNYDRGCGIVHHPDCNCKERKNEK